MDVSQTGLDLIKSFEGCRLSAYPDPATGGEPITICWGHTGGVKLGDAKTQSECDDLLKQDVAYPAAAIDHLVTVPLTQGQFDALVSLTFNIGQMAFGNSTLRRMLNNGDYAGAADQFLRWDKGPNGPMPGLTRRRAAERALFES